MLIRALDDLSDIGLLFLASAKAGRIPSADAMRQMVNAIAAAKGEPGEDILAEADAIAKGLRHDASRVVG